MSLAKRVLLIGMSGADWPTIHPLLDSGQLPNLERLVDEGSIGRIASLQPGVMPLVWTSIVTGVRPSRHGNIGTLHREGDRAIPSTMASRTVSAFWSNTSAAGLKTHVINWPTYPAEPTNGTFVSHLFTRFGDGVAPAPHTLPRAATGPTVGLSELRIDPHELTAAELLPFVPHAAAIDQMRDPGLAIVASRLADAVSAHAMATAVLDSDWDVAAVCYDFLDRLGHSFMRFHPPRRDVTQRSFELYRGVMTQAYRFCDQMLGQVLRMAGDDTHVVLFSDHGIRSGDDRPHRESFGRGDTSWQTPLGLLAIRGPGIHADRWIWGGNLMDIAPTVYRLLGISVEGLDGKALKDAFLDTNAVIDRGNFRSDERHTLVPPLNDQEAAAIERWLLADGYLQDDDVQNQQAAITADVTGDSNLAQSHLQFGETAAALALFESCHRRRPDSPRFAMAVAHCHAALGHLDNAHDFLQQALELGTPPWVGDRMRGQLLAADNQHEQALEHLLMSEAARPHQRGVNAEIGTVYAKLGRRDDARRAFYKELAIDPNEPAALHGLGKLLLEDTKYDEALEHLLASAALREVSPETHYLLAQTFRMLSRPHEALRAVERALRQAPSYAEAAELRRDLLLESR